MCVWSHQEQSVVSLVFFAGLDKVHGEFGIVTLAHNILKIAGIRQPLSEKNHNNRKAVGEKRCICINFSIKYHLFLHIFEMT
jgi:hypothetical protein